MPAAYRYITQGAHKPTTGGTRSYGLFARVIKAPGLVADLQRFTGMAHRQRPVYSRKNVCPQKTAAVRTGSQ